MKKSQKPISIKKEKLIKSAYIHIPFCNHICSYCDFAKFLYQKQWISKYLTALEQEIKSNYQGEALNTIYIGGGTPTALDEKEFARLLAVVHRLQLQETYEYTVECNVESLTEEKIKCMKQYGINRISIGVETFHTHHLQQMNRHHTKKQIIQAIQSLKQYGFENINIDLIYALPSETLEEVKQDLLEFLKLDIPHISTYALMIESNTQFYLQKKKAIDEELEIQMYETICNTLKQHGYKHYEISNFAKPNYTSKHNLTYWNNQYYYGFGLGASGYILEMRYTNTRSFTNYCNGKFCLEQEKIDKKINMEHEMMLGLRKLEGVNMLQFKEKYGKEMTSIFPIQNLQKEGKLQVENGYVRIPEPYLYISNDIIVQFIDD